MAAASSPNPLAFPTLYSPKFRPLLLMVLLFNLFWRSFAVPESLNLGCSVKISVIVFGVATSMDISKLPIFSPAPEEIDPTLGMLGRITVRHRASELSWLHRDLILHAIKNGKKITMLDSPSDELPFLALHNDECID
jgi:hypothetical protein